MHSASRRLPTFLVLCGLLACDRSARDGADTASSATDTASALQRADAGLDAACDSVQQLMAATTARTVERTDGEIAGAALGPSRVGCRLTVADTLQPDVAQRPLEIVWQQLIARGWSLDDAWVADAPDGSMLGLRAGTLLCVLQHYWPAGSDDERMTRPEIPFRYDMTIECFRDTAGP